MAARLGWRRMTCVRAVTNGIKLHYVTCHQQVAALAACCACAVPWLPWHCCKCLQFFTVAVKSACNATGDACRLP